MGKSSTASRSNTTNDSQEDGRERDVFDDLGEELLAEKRVFDEEEMFADIEPTRSGERFSVRRSTRTRSEQFSHAHTDRLTRTQARCLTGPQVQRVSYKRFPPRDSEGTTASTHDPSRRALRLDTGGLVVGGVGSLLLRAGRSVSGQENSKCHHEDEQEVNDDSLKSPRDEAVEENAPRINVCEQRLAPGRIVDRSKIDEAPNDSDATKVEACGAEESFATMRLEHPYSTDDDGLKYQKDEAVDEDVLLFDLREERLAPRLPIHKTKVNKARYDSDPTNVEVTGQEELTASICPEATKVKKKRYDSDPTKAEASGPEGCVASMYPRPPNSLRSFRQPSRRSPGKGV